PVNPHEKKVGGIKAYPTVSDIEGPVDLALIAIPSAGVRNVLEHCGEKGVLSAVVITAGYSEIGNRGPEQDIVDVAKSYGIRLIGPNTVGIANNDNALNATFLMDSKQGHIAFLSQSGALGAAIIYKTVYEHLGFSKFVSLGNMADIDFCDMLNYLEHDDATKSVALYMEGVRDGKSFIESARRCSLKKPVIALKSGISGAGARATASHTGSLAGNDRIYDAAFEQAGVIRAPNIDRLLDAAKVFSQPCMNGNNVAIITNAGGPGILAADECERVGLAVGQLSQALQENLRALLPSYASVNNPIDTIAQAGHREYFESIKALQNDKSIDAILAIIVVPTFTNIGMNTHARALIEGWDASTPLVTCFMSGEVAETSMRLVDAHGIPSYPTPERAAWALGALWKHSRWCNEH
ncbi:MAG TPA: acetyl-CoA synthetase, partial [Methanomicrobia archaeon]|nr:acetyl-CoA synthetase [Methanomicrobia archaeon]